MYMYVRTDRRTRDRNARCLQQSFQAGGKQLRKNVLKAATTSIA